MKKGGSELDERFSIQVRRCWISFHGMYRLDSSGKVNNVAMTQKRSKLREAQVLYQIVSISVSCKHNCKLLRCFVESCTYVFIYSYVYIVYIVAI